MSTFDEDMKEMARQVTAEVIFTINSSAKIYSDVKDLKASKMKEYVFAYAQEHNNEFGSVFEAELEVVDWNKVVKGI